MRRPLAPLLVALLAWSSSAFSQDEASGLQDRFQAASRAMTEGRYAEAVELLTGLIENEQLPPPARATVAYNLACAFSLGARVDAALEWFQRSIELGYPATAERVLRDPDLASLRADPRFAAHLKGLDGAADANHDGLVGIDELKTWATTAVHEKSGGRQRPTAPRIEGGEDFPLARTH